eukprot:TRINITY_DN47579_c0_g1_i1.p1 TRINITY_DN47579_c0_g1~~TRINITY_DN47579_c0_g1_i1.p1  ORF type:complete len:256 (+),score=49.08 TRINITY_DN47579_c0_g1_i1:216-983(+)
MSAAESPISKAAGSQGETSPTSGKEKKKKQKDKDREEGDEKNAPSAWIEAVLVAHNKRREAHWVAPLIWSEECYEHARMQAQACAEEGRRLPKNYTDSLSGRHGQTSSGPMKNELKWDSSAAESIVSQWYNEIEKYDFNNPGPQKGTANFTQMMWSVTCSVGMALSSDGKFCVANYFPAIGNALSYKYERNLKKPCSDAPVWITRGIEELSDFDKTAPCTSSSWERHEELAKLLKQGLEFKPLDSLQTDLPELDY